MDIAFICIINARWAGGEKKNVPFVDCYVSQPFKALAVQWWWWVERRPANTHFPYCTIQPGSLKRPGCRERYAAGTAEREEHCVTGLPAAPALPSSSPRLALSSSAF